MLKKHEVMKNLITGMSGGALLMISDWLMGALKSDNVSNGIVQSSWREMASWRFEAALLIAAVAVVMLFIGARDMIRVMKMSTLRKDPWSVRAVQAFELGAISVVVSELFLHVKGCILPILYKALYGTNLMGADMLTIVEDVFFYMAIPFYVFTAIMLICTSVPYVYQIWLGRIHVPRFFMALNPLVIWLLGLIFRLFKVTVITNFTQAFISLGIVLLFYGMLQHVIHTKSREEEE